MDKTCFKCERVLPRTEFYAHSRMADGLLGKCKECTKTDVKARYAMTIDDRHAYEAKRNATPERKAALRRYSRQRYRQTPEKAKARSMIGNAVRDGRVTRQPCEVCGDPKSQAHHEDYSKPLDVKWLCFYHHRVAHGQQPSPKRKNEAA